MEKEILKANCELIFMDIQLNGSQTRAMVDTWQLYQKVRVKEVKPIIGEKLESR